MTRNLPWILAALIALPALAAAQSPENATTTSAASEPTFTLGAEPSRAEVRAGGAVTYVIYAKSRVEQTLTLGLEGLPDWAAASWSAAQVKVGPDAPARAALTVAVRDVAARSAEPIVFAAHATSEAGERHAVKLSLHVVIPTAADSFGLKLDPEAQRIAPGGLAKFAIHLRSATNVTIDLAATLARGEGYRYELSPERLDVGPGSPGVATLVVKAGDGASDYAAFEVVGSDGQQRHAATAKVALVKPVATPPNATAARFALAADPSSQPIRPGGEAKFEIVAKASGPMTIQLGLGARMPPGYHARLADDTLRIGDDGVARAALYVTADENATRGAAIEVWGASGSGERHAVSVKVVMPTAAAQEPAKPRPSATEPREIKITIEIPGKEPIVLRVSGAAGLRMLAGDDAMPGAPAHHGRAWLLFQFGEEVNALAGP